jgi:hypothetical protein
MLIDRYYYDERTKDEMGGTCSTMGSSGTRTNFWQENVKWKYLLGCIGVDAKIILKYILKTWAIQLLHFLIPVI